MTSMDIDGLISHVAGTHLGVCFLLCSCVVCGPRVHHHSRGTSSPITPGTHCCPSVATPTSGGRHTWVDTELASVQDPAYSEKVPELAAQPLTLTTTNLFPVFVTTVT